MQNLNWITRGKLIYFFILHSAFCIEPMPISVSIVEDNDKLRATLARVINRAEGFRCVSQYANAEDALKDLPQVRPDVVLMDINLPGMNGVKCVQQLKALLPEIQAQYEALKNERQSIVEADIQTAFELDAAQLADLVARLEKHTGRKVKAKVSVNKELIGGVRIGIGDKVIDASARAQLGALESALKA